MAPYLQAETYETAKLFAAKVARDRAAGAFGQPVTGATNRYRKLEPGSSNVRAGALPYSRGPEGYKQPTEHAGYSRKILAYNPRRYNAQGEELGDENSDFEADADAREEDPYAGIHIHETLAPLKHISELPVHPGLAPAYVDPALANLVKIREDNLRQERRKLSDLQNVQERLTLDLPWAPCGLFETEDDIDLYEPKPRPSENSRKRRYEDDSAQNGVNGYAQTTTVTAPSQSVLQTEASNAASGANHDAQSLKEPTTSGDVDMQDAVAQEDGLPEASADQVRPEDNAPLADGVEDHANGADNQNPTGSETGSPPSLSRRVTRAHAAEKTNIDGGSQRSASPSVAFETLYVDHRLLTVDPVYNIPSHLSTQSRLGVLLAYTGMPYQELVETRRYIMGCVQRQIETRDRFYWELEQLYKVKRQKTHVWQSAIAERHLGEDSDGEDHVDKEEWGLKEGELKKGRDEDEAVEAAAEEEAQQTRGRAKGKRKKPKEKLVD